MKREDAEKLCAAFPIIYRENVLLRREPNDPSFDFECCSGWKDLIWEFSEALEAIAAQVPENPPVIVQIKEKYGELTIYYRNVPPGHHAISICLLDDKLTELSLSTCEFCGRAGELRDTGWEKTMCDDCFSMWNEKDRFTKLFEKYD